MTETVVFYWFYIDFHESVQLQGRVSTTTVAECGLQDLAKIFKTFSLIKSHMFDS